MQWMRRIEAGCTDVELPYSELEREALKRTRGTSEAHSAWLLNWPFLEELL